MKITSLSKIIYYISIGLVFLFIGLNISFLYYNFYKTIIQSEVIYILSNEVSLEVVNTKLWIKVKKNLENKKASAILPDQPIQDPFKDN